jgi:hypothetical protein
MPMIKFSISPTAARTHAQRILVRSGPNSPHSIGFTNVLFDLFGPRLALGHASRTEALLPLEPNSRGLDLSLTADHYLHRAFDAEEAILCFCMHWSSRANGTRLIFGAGSARCGAESEERPRWGSYRGRQDRFLSPEIVLGDTTTRAVPR